MNPADLRFLPFREREIIRLMQGVDGYKYTLEEVGRIFKVSRERMKTIYERALVKLKQRGVAISP